MKWFLLPFKKYADFSGRSRRKEYWMFYLFNIIIFFVLYLMIVLDKAKEFDISLFYVYGILIIIPFIAVTVRRLHDVGKSGWFALICLIPLGGIWIFILLCTDSNPDENEYGPNPKLDDLDTHFDRKKIF